ncbi:MAG: pilin [Candidatus Parcubacteria bacterium]|nr:pilin [Candidatus Parcubacteria bacterium]
MQRVKKFLIITVIVFISFLSLFFISNKQVLAQNTVTISTVRYSVFGPDVFVLAGSYAGNTQKKPLTTYFEYKRNDSNLGVAKDRKETIKIIRNTENICPENINISDCWDVDESNVFYSSPEVQPASTYYFRAVGYFNDNSTQKFYGNILSFKTGPIYVGSLYYNITLDCSLTGQIRNIITNSCETPLVCDSDHIRNIVTNRCDVAVNCVSPEVRDIVTNACVTSVSCNSKKFEVLNIITNKCDIVTPCTKEEVRNIVTNKCEPLVICDGPNQVKNIITNKCETITPCASNKIRDINTQKCVIRLTRLSTQEEGTPNESSTNSDSDLTPPISGGVGVNCPNDDCGFNDFIALINRVISFILFNLAIPISAIMFAYAGFLLVTAGGAGEKTKAKDIFTNTATGLVIAAGAWLVVNTLLSILAKPGMWSWIGF